MEGREIRYDESSAALEDIFGNEEAFGDYDGGDIDIELDFAWPRAGPVKIVCEGGPGQVRVMNNEDSVVSIKSMEMYPVEVILKRTTAIVSTVEA